MLGVEVVTGDVEKSLQKLSKRLGLDVRDVYYDFMRLWGNNLIKFTPPFSGSPASGNKSSAKKAGEEAVAAGYNTLFYPVDNPAALESWNDRMATGAGDIFVTTSRGKTKISKAKLKRVSVSSMRSIHARNRDRKGRVRPRRDSGEFAAGRVLVPRKDLRRAIKDEQKRVGFFKAGWLKATKHFAKRSKGRVVAPAWVKRHLSPGDKVDAMKPNGSGFIEASNRVAWAGVNKSLLSAVAFTQKIVQKGLLKQTNATVARLTKQFNSGQI